MPLNVIFLGGENAGKSSYLKVLKGEDPRYVTKTFGIDLVNVTFLTKNEYYSVDVWDCSGNSEYKGVCQFCETNRMDAVVIFRSMSYSYDYMNILLEKIKLKNPNIHIVNIWSRNDMSEEQKYHELNSQFHFCKKEDTFKISSAHSSLNVLYKPFNRVLSLCKGKDIIIEN